MNNEIIVICGKNRNSEHGSVKWRLDFGDYALKPKNKCKDKSKLIDKEFSPYDYFEI